MFDLNLVQNDFFYRREKGVSFNLKLDPQIDVHTVQTEPKFDFACSSDRRSTGAALTIEDSQEKYKKNL
jgi:hypothetical protein